ncbi:MAG: RIP metalloprotease RseP [Tissierellia bacterium]|nr:RIP metalloprotease RseP [Tissierellia bacterium]
MLTLVSAVFVFFIIILFHEFGHFIVAKAAGIKVNEFSIGMGPKLIQRKKGETKYSIRALPVGGYCSMEGEDQQSDDPRGFNNASTKARIAVILAGSIMNLILAIIVLSIVSYSLGVPTTSVSETIADSPAELAGIKSGDVIISINDVNINSWDDIINEIGSSNPEDAMKVKVLRDKETIDITLKPTVSEDNRVMIGIVPLNERSFKSAIVGGFKETIEMMQIMFNFIQMIFKGGVSARDLSGPVGIIYTIGEAAKYGFINLLYLMGFISVNLGVFNLLPVPALDGSRIIFILIEIIRGKPIDPEKEGYVHFVGFILLILLMITVTYFDINRFNIFGR